MLGAALLLVLVGLLDYDLFFLASLVGLLVLAAATEPTTVTPRWRRRLRWIAYAGLAAFALVLLRRLTENLPRGLL
jgi:multisubunit Na+/H+ antiporter MnhE subunit